jgi:hypothetical protein
MLDQAADGQPAFAGNDFLTAVERNRMFGAESHNWSAMRVEQARMGIAYVNGQIRALTAGVLLLLTLSLGGCVTSTAGSSLMDARADETPAPRKTSGYPSLEVLPPPAKIMTADERLKLEKELTAARQKAKRGARQAAQPAR